MTEQEAQALVTGLLQCRNEFSSHLNIQIDTSNVHQQRRTQRTAIKPIKLSQRDRELREAFRNK